MVKEKSHPSTKEAEEERETLSSRTIWITQQDLVSDIKQENRIETSLSDSGCAQ